MEAELSKKRLSISFNGYESSEIIGLIVKGIRLLSNSFIITDGKDEFLVFIDSINRLSRISFELKQKNQMSSLSNEDKSSLLGALKNRSASLTLITLENLLNAADLENDGMDPVIINQAAQSIMGILTE
jgi:hypothetical protein